MEEDRQDVQLQPEATDLEIVPLEQEVLRDDLEIRETEQTILLRYLITGVVLTLYASTLASTITLFRSQACLLVNWVSALSSWLSSRVFSPRSKPPTRMSRKALELIS